MSDQTRWIDHRNSHCPVAHGTIVTIKDDADMQWRITADDSFNWALVRAFQCDPDQPPCLDGPLCVGASYILRCGDVITLQFEDEDGLGIFNERYGWKRNGVSWSGEKANDILCRYYGPTESPAAVEAPNDSGIIRASDLGQTSGRITIIRTPNGIEVFGAVEAVEETKQSTEQVRAVDGLHHINEALAKHYGTPVPDLSIPPRTEAPKQITSSKTASPEPPEDVCDDALAIWQSRQREKCERAQSHKSAQAPTPKPPHRAPGSELADIRYAICGAWEYGR